MPDRSAYPLPPAASGPGPLVGFISSPRVPGPLNGSGIRGFQRGPTGMAYLACACSARRRRSAGQATDRPDRCPALAGAALTGATDPLGLVCTSAGPSVDRPVVRSSLAGSGSPESDESRRSTLDLDLQATER